MPTLKPRISITLDHHELAILDRYAAASGTPRASILADLIRVTLPQLKEASELIEMANAAPRHIKQGLVENLANATADAMGFLQPFNNDYGMIMNRLQQELNLTQATRKREKSKPRGAQPGARDASAPRHPVGGEAGKTPTY
jgi:hypothetical protein